MKIILALIALLSFSCSTVALPPPAYSSKRNLEFIKAVGQMSEHFNQYDK